MPITVQCGCGKRTGVSDALAGKTVRCPKCGSSVFVTAAPGTKTAAKPQKSAPAFYMSSGKIIALCSVAALVIIGIVFYLGPVRVSHQWDSMDMKARGTIRNVITYALKAKMSHTGEWDPTVPHAPPSVANDDVTFFRPLLSMSLPKKVSFLGRSSAGEFGGTYDTQTGAVDADVSYGGHTVAGLIDLKKPSGKFHLVAHEEGDKPVCEIDGTQMDILYPKAEE
jgi:hypothetical protein